MKIFRQVLLISVFLLAGVSNAYCENPSRCLRQGTLISAAGLGRLPSNVPSQAKARLLAVRAAVVDARRNLLACLMEKDSRNSSKFQGIVKGALVTDVQYLASGWVKVTVTMDTSEAP
jgi:hypothetical protein